jgi:hypothetical protein
MTATMLDHRSMDEKHRRADGWHTLRHVLFSCLRFLESGCRILRVFEGCARTGTDGTIGFDFVSASSLASRFDGKPERQRASSAHPFENRKRVRNPLLGMASEKNQEQRWLRHPSKTLRMSQPTKAPAKIMIVEFSVRILGPLCEENSEHHLDP